MNLRLVVAAAVQMVLGGTAVARAGTTVYYFQSSFFGGTGSVDGDLTFDTGTDEFTAADLTASGVATDGVPLTVIDDYGRRLSGSAGGLLG